MRVLFLPAKTALIKAIKQAHRNNKNRNSFRNDNDYIIIM